MKKFLSIALSLAMVLVGTTALMGQGGVIDPTKQWMTADNVSPLDFSSTNGCSAFLTTGAYAANPANSGALAAPSMVRAQAQNDVYQVTTSAAASALTLTCDIVPPSFRTTPGKGVQITGLVVYYGTQTTALTSITSPNTFSTITLPAVGAAFSGTVAAISGTPVFSPVLASAQLPVTTSGQCYAQSVVPAAPITVNNANQRVVFEEVFNQTAGTATVYQICGVDVYYNNIVF